MLVNCNNKGCMKTTEAKLNLKTNEVICQECGKVITNVTEFTKRNMKMLGQVIKVNEKVPFMARCPKCAKDVSLYIQDDKAYCKECNSEVTITKAYFMGLKQYLENKEKEDLEDEKEEPQKTKRGRKPKTEAVEVTEGTKKD